MAQTVYKRQLVGQQSGVQVNMPRDTVERMLAESGDQSFAAVGYFSRGRIDRPFLVSSSKMQRYLGSPKSVRLSSLNETYIQVFEAFQYGAAAAVVSRVVSSAAKNLWLSVKADSGNLAFEIVENAPVSDYLFALRVADCIAEGVYITVSQGDTHDEFDIIIRERDLDSLGKDTTGGEILYTFSGSLKADAKDDVGESYFIVDVAEKYYGDWLEIQVNQETQWDNKLNAHSDKAVLFTDTGAADTAAYQKAANALGATNLQYRYILGDSSNINLVNTLLNVGQKYNRILVQEVSGSLSPEAAINWKNNFQYDAQGGMYGLWIWSPIKRQDPTGAAGVVQIGTVGQKIGKACARNAVINGFGLPALNRPIAGKDFYLSGSRFTQTYFPDDVELAALAKAHINPAVYAEFHDGSGYVWDDSLSGAKKNGISRLENAVEISQWIQERVGKYARGLLQKPMTEAIRLMTRFVESELQAAQASEWLTPSTQLGGLAYTYVIAPSDRNPEDEMMVTLNIAIDGVVRRIFVSQNMYSRS